MVIRKKTRTFYTFITGPLSLDLMTNYLFPGRKLFAQAVNASAPRV